MREIVEVKPAAIVQSAVDLEQVRDRLAVLVTEIRKGEALMEHGNRILMDRRYQAGVLFSEARKQFPKSGPKAAGWGEFCEAVGVSRDSAARYMEIAAQVAAQPELAERRTFMDLYRELGLAAEGQSTRSAAAAAANPPAQIEAPKQGTKQKTRAAAPAKPAEAPKPAPKPAVKVAYDRGAGGAGDDAQDAPDYEGPVTNIDPPVKQDKPLSEHAPLFIEGAKAAPDADDGKPAPEPPPWDSLEACLERICGMVQDLIAAHPDDREKIGAALARALV